VGRQFVHKKGASRENDQASREGMKREEMRAPKLAEVYGGELGQPID